MRTRLVLVSVGLCVVAVIVLVATTLPRPEVTQIAGNTLMSNALINMSRGRVVPYIKGVVDLTGGSPAEVSVPRGGSATFELVVANEGSETYRDVLLYPSGGSEEDQTRAYISLLRGSFRNTLPRGITVLLNGKPYLKLKVGPHEILKVRVTVTAAKDVESGEYEVAINLHVPLGRSEMDFGDTLYLYVKVRE